MKIAIFGAGSTGCYIGGTLAVAGLDTTLICRERIKSEIEAAGGLTLTDYTGQDQNIMPSALLTQIDNAQFDLVIVTLKCHQLPSASDDLKTLAQKGAALMFMQNGLGSLEAICQDLADATLLRGITPYNVLPKGQATFHRGTEGDLIFQRHATTLPVTQALEKHGVGVEICDDMQPVIAGKLMLNLNNAINAIANIPLKAELQDRRYRKVLAQAMTEWIAVCQAQGVVMKQYTAVKPILVPKILRLPNFVFRAIASKMLAIDPEARSSMWEDIQAGHQTEIEFLNGAVSRLGQDHDIPTPVNAGITALIARLEQKEIVMPEELFALVP